MSPVHSTRSNCAIQAGGRGLSESERVAALESEIVPRLVRRCDLQSEAFQNLPDADNLLRVRGREFARTDPQRILEPDPNVAAHCGRDGGNLHLRRAGSEHGPEILVSEQ